MSPLSELGLSSSDQIAVEHKIVLAATSTLDAHLRALVKTSSECSRRSVRILEIVGYGFAAYLVLSGEKSIGSDCSP